MTRHSSVAVPEDDSSVSDPEPVGLSSLDPESSSELLRIWRKSACTNPSDSPLELAPPQESVGTEAFFGFGVGSLSGFLSASAMPGMGSHYFPAFLAWYCLVTSSKLNHSLPSETHLS